MKVIDPGHSYNLDIYDGYGVHPLVFMKREGGRYPGNSGHYPGTNSQEVLRVLINRALYLNKQIPCSETAEVIYHLRMALLLFEERAARLHDRVLQPEPRPIEEVPTCPTCGHIQCKDQHHATPTP